MLTRSEALANYEFETGRVHPDRLTQRTHAHYRHYADQMLRVYRQGAGKTRKELHRAVAAIFAAESDCPQRRIDAFCKLLDDASVYDRDRRGNAVRLRREVFRRAARYHPLVQTPDRLFEAQEARIKSQIAAELGRSWDEIERDLFADVIEFHRLSRFEGYEDAGQLLSRYNVAQVQAALFDAETMIIWARDDFKTILRYAKLARLMHTIHRLDDGQYRIRLDGPTSVMRQTRRYGANMARFLPALVACRDWRMHATIRTRRSGWVLSLDLSSEDGLKSHLPPPEEFDSQVEQTFAERWGDQPRDGWTLAREDEILYQTQRTFIPDFVFRHEDGRNVLLEIVGFWTPEYLQAKLEKLQNFSDQEIWLAVPEDVAASLPELPGQPVIPYKTALRLKDVLDRLNRENPPEKDTGEA
jgi:uncharacterized protein